MELNMIGTLISKITSKIISNQFRAHSSVSDFASLGDFKALDNIEALGRSAFAIYKCFVDFETLALSELEAQRDFKSF